MAGKGDIAAKLRAAVDAHVAAVRKAVYAEATEIFTASQVEVPVDTGRLRASGAVSPPEGPDGTVTISYGTEYALAVHETHRTRSKYLEGPFVRAMPGMAERIAARARKYAKRGEGMGRT